MARPQRVSTEEILLIARKYFIDRGHSASLKSIAEALGLSHSAILQRFGSKRELMIRSLEPPVDFPWPKGFLVGPEPSQMKAVQQLKEVCEMLMLFLHKHMPQIMVLQSAGISPYEVFEDRTPLPILACQRIREWIERGQHAELFADCNSAALASTIVGTMFVRSRLEGLCWQAQGDHAHQSMAQYNDQLLGAVDEVVNLFATILFQEVPIVWATGHQEFTQASSADSSDVKGLK